MRRKFRARARRQFRSKLASSDRLRRGEKRRMSTASNEFRTAKWGPVLMICAFSRMPMSGFGQGSHVATLAESLSRTSIRAPAISPDARSIAYLQRETNWKENEFVSQLWRVEVGSGKAVQ